MTGVKEYMCDAGLIKYNPHCKQILLPPGGGLSLIHK